MDYTTVDMTVRSLLADILRTDVPPAGAVGWGFVDDNGELVSVPLGDLGAPAAAGTGLVTATYEVGSSGAQTIFQQGATWFGDVGVRSQSVPGQSVALDFGTGYTFGPDQLNILAAVGANLQPGDTITYTYASGAVSGQQPAPVYTAGAGIDISAANEISALSLYADVVVHTADVALTAADYGKLHIISGNTSLTLTLPAPIDGNTLAVSVEQGSRPLHTVVTPSGVQMDGLDSVYPWAGELRQWAVVNGSFVKTNGRVRAMKAKMRFEPGRNQSVPAGAVVPIQLGMALDVGGPGMIDLVNYGLLFPRAGSWKIGFLCNLVGVATGTYVEYLARINKTLDERVVNGITTPANIAGDTFSALRTSEVRQVAAGDAVDLVAYLGASSGTVDNRAGVPWLLPTLYVEEQNPY
jgi:hypothetical protein